MRFPTTIEIGRPTPWTGLSVLLLLPGLLGGCGSPAVEEPAAVAPSRPRNVVVEPPEHRRAEAGVRVTGVVFSRNDHSSPHEPLGRGMVVAVPAARFAAFQAGERGLQGVPTDELTDFVLPLKILSELEVTSCTVGRDGTYSLSLPPGDYVFCLGNVSRIEAVNAAAVGAAMVGAFEITVSAEELQTVVPVLTRTTGELTLFN